jgi:hypothetical protein
MLAITVGIGNNTSLAQHKKEGGQASRKLIKNCLRRVEEDQPRGLMAAARWVLIRPTKEGSLLDLVYPKKIGE